MVVGKIPSWLPTVCNNYRGTKEVLLHPIPVQRPFQIIGVDVLELPKTESVNKFAIVFQDFLTKVYPAPDQKAI